MDDYGHSDAVPVGAKASVCRHVPDMRDERRESAELEIGQELDGLRGKCADLEDENEALRKRNDFLEKLIDLFAE
jgi:hypothetical protein